MSPSIGHIGQTPSPQNIQDLILPAMTPDILATLLDACGEPAASSLSPRQGIIAGPAVVIPSSTLALLVEAGVLHYPAIEPMAMTDEFRHVADIILNPQTHVTVKAWKQSEPSTSEPIHLLQTHAMYPYDIASGDGITMNAVHGGYRIIPGLDGLALPEMVASALPPAAAPMASHPGEDKQFKAVLQESQALLLCFLLDELQRQPPTELAYTSTQLAEAMAARWGNEDYNELLLMASGVGQFATPPTAHHLKSLVAEFTNAGWLEMETTAADLLARPGPELIHLSNTLGTLFGGFIWNRANLGPHNQILLSLWGVAYGEHALLHMERCANRQLKLELMSREAILDRLNQDCVPPSNEAASLAPLVSEETHVPPSQRTSLQKASPQPVRGSQGQVSGSHPSEDKASKNRKRNKEILFWIGLAVLAIVVGLFKVGQWAIEEDQPATVAAAGPHTQLFPLQGGFMDRHGEVIIPLDTYTHVGDFNDGLALACTGQQEVLSCSYINTQNQVVVSFSEEYYMDSSDSSPQLDAQSSLYSDGILLHQIRTDQWELLDGQGGFLANLTNVAQVGYFSEGENLAPYQPIEHKYWGYLDNTGRTIIQPTQFLQAFSFHDGLARVVVAGTQYDQEVQYIHTDGTTAWKGQRFGAGTDFEDGTAGVQSLDPAHQGRWGIIDIAGNYVVEPQYYWAGPFSEGKAAVLTLDPMTQEPRMGFINRLGEPVITASFVEQPLWLSRVNPEPRYHGRHLYVFRQGVVAVNTNPGGCCTTGYINAIGQVLR